MYNKLSPERLSEIKKVMLAGTLTLTHKPILPSIIEFSNRSPGWLNDLRRLRETMAFKPGPSKRRIASSESSSEDETTGSRETLDATTKATKRPSKASASTATRVRAKFSNSALSAEDQAALFEAFSAPVTRVRKKK